MSIAAILKQKPYNLVIVKPEDRVFDVVRGLARQKVGVAVVMEGETLVGIISERDVMRGLEAQGPDVLDSAVDTLMIRDVKLAEPVREITVAATLQRMLLSLVAVGADVEWLPGIAAGQTLAIGDMQISGV